MRSSNRLLISRSATSTFGLSRRSSAAILEKTNHPRGGDRQQPARRADIWAQVKLTLPGCQPLPCDDLQQLQLHIIAGAQNRPPKAEEPQGTSRQHAGPPIMSQVRRDDSDVSNSYTAFLCNSTRTYRWRKKVASAARLGEVLGRRGPVTVAAN